MSVAVHIHDLWDCMEKLMDGALELAELQKELEARTADNLTPIAIDRKSVV